MARIAFVDVQPDAEGMTWAIYACLDCAMERKHAQDLWTDKRIPYMIGK